MLDQIDFPQSTRITVNGVALEVFEAGKENAGNPIVLCHGWPEHAYSWRHQMPALAAAGYHVIVPNQRGYGNSARPDAVDAYDIAQLTGDLVGLLEHFGYADAIFVGHDWGANVVWSLAQLHPKRVNRLIALSLPYQQRGDMPWVAMLEALFGGDHYMVHFNRRPGEADAVLDAHRQQFLRNLYRKNLPPMPAGAPEPGNAMSNLARVEAPLGEPLLSDRDLQVFDEAFAASGFSPSINWYRNLDRNWQLLGEIDPIVQQPALMIYGAQDLIPMSETLSDFVPNVEVATLDCGHWIQQEKPEETNQVILNWLQPQAS